MKPRKYQVIFTNGEVEYVTAFSAVAAEILAQANQINKGNSFEMKEIRRRPDDFRMCDNDDKLWPIV